MPCRIWTSPEELQSRTKTKALKKKTHLNNSNDKELDGRGAGERGSLRDPSVWLLTILLWARTMFGCRQFPTMKGIGCRPLISVCEWVFN